jgi:methionyl-tRNA synthetase
MASRGFIAYETARGRRPSVDPDPEQNSKAIMSTERFYITTPIFYPNGVPHIGHAYTAIATDVLARFQRHDGKDVFFLSGTDEHGQKMQQTAEKEGIKPIELADRNSAVFRDMMSRLNCSNDDFIRTTEERHKRSVQELWRRMEANGDIYLDKYGGWYSVRQEAYFDEAKPPSAKTACGANRSARRSNGWKRRAIISGCRPMATSCLELYESKSGLRRSGRTAQRSGEFRQIRPADLSISRTTFDWGVPVPGNDKHVMYVWVDALTNYITAAGFPDETPTSGTTGRPST